MNPFTVILLVLLSTNLLAQTYIDVDIDDDGLIEVYNMETLNAMRYQLDGSGLQLDETAVEITTGCAPGGCKGYELTRDLDFSSADSYQNIANLNRWADGAGWQPIGDATHPFTAIFKTNNGSTPNVIYNLMINRPSGNGVGLFGHIRSGAKISGIGLLNAEITGHSQVGGLVGKSAGGDISNSYVRGRVVGKGIGVGLLAGSSDGLITNSYANGEVIGEGNGVGGLVGASSGSITNSYAMGSVVGAANHVGGLVGNNSQGTISNCYTTGSVSGSEDIGGLVGISSLGKLIGNYVSGKTSGKRYIGGLVGINVGGTITRSYWDKTTNNLKQNTGGVGLSASELQSKNAQNDDSTKPYYKWSTANWDFGTAEQYPILKYATGSDPQNPACGPGQTLPNCGALLLGQHASLERIMFSEQVDLSPIFKPTQLNYQLDISPQITQLQLTPIASNPASTIHISRNGTAVSTTNSVITLDKDTSITIEVSAPNQRPAQYQFKVNHLQGITIFGIPNEAIDEGELIILDAFHSLDAPEDQTSYRWTQTTGKPILSGTDNDRAALFLSIPEDYVSMTEDYAKLRLNIEVTDGKTTLNKDINLVIAKRDNGNIMVDSPNLSLLELTAPEIDLDNDPDGAGKSLSYQWQHRPPSAGAEWANLDGATEQTHTISALTEWHTEYRVLISYTDGQGYPTLATGEAIVYSLKTAFAGLLRGAASEEVPYPKDAKPQRSSQTPSATAFFDCNGNNDIDDDNNGLIEICDLDGLDAIRYQLDGTGYKSGRSATKITTGCPADGCNGYELVRDLDFNDVGSYRLASTKKSEWTTEGGWTPIGVSSNAFRAKFNGNGYTISNLMIRSPHVDNIALFGYVRDYDSKITNVGLIDVNIKGRDNVGGLAGFTRGSIVNSYVTGSVSGNSDVGGLAGYHSNGSITHSYATADVEGFASSQVGGLVGYIGSGIIKNSYATGKVEAGGNFVKVGGLVGGNSGTVKSSYATGSVEALGGSVDAGGLVGQNFGTIENSYATGDVTGLIDSDVGGLVGYIGSGIIKNSYATGKVESLVMPSRVGGLIGRKTGGSITASYWDTKTSEIITSADGTSQTTMELQKPTAAIDIYSGWNDDNNWDFGSSRQYPVLKYVECGDTNNPAYRRQENTITNLPQCGGLLSPIGRGLSELGIVEGNLSPSFTAAELIYRGTVVVFDGTPEIRLRPKALNSSATITIIVDDELLNSDLSSDTLSTTTSLSTTDITKINIAVNNGSSATSVQYTLYLNYYAYQEDVDSDGDGLIEIDSLEKLNAIRYQLDGSGYRESDTMPKITKGCPDNICKGYELTEDLDFNDAVGYDAMAEYLDWQPIGGRYNPFIGIFEGNSHTISNLNIHRMGRDRGLFGHMGTEGKINNIGLLQVYVIGDWRVGGLVGGNRGKIRNSYTTGTVKGLKEDLGGLVGANMKDGFIANSYSSCLVKNIATDGGVHIGGLVGSNSNAIITDSYATGTIMGNGIAGGLVGLHEQASQIFNSYATGSVLGGTGSYRGGLIGRSIGSSRVYDSYWDKQTSGEATTSAGGEDKFTTELQEPTAAVKIYDNWSEKNWDFGGSNHYPILKYSDGDSRDKDSEDSDANNPTCRNGGETNADLPKCGDLIFPALRYGLSKLQVEGGKLSSTFDVSRASYRGAFISSTNGIRLIPTTVNSSATVSISVNGMLRDSNLISGNPSSRISLNATPTHIKIEVNNPGTLLDIKYDLYLTYYEERNIDSDGDGLIEIDSLEKLDAMRYQLDGTGYRAGRNMLLITTGCPDNVCSGYELVKDLDFNESVSEATWATGRGWQPVGSSIKPFTAIFEGNNHTISNLMIDRPFSSQLGLFGMVGNNAKISNIGLLDMSINGNNNTGGLAGINRGRITNSHTSGEVSYGQAILYGQGMGGLVGNNQSTGIIINCYSFAEISGRKKSGGLVGHNHGMIRNSFASGNVITGFEIGGLVGELRGGKIINSHSSGDVYGSLRVGGLVGQSIGSSRIINSYANPRSIRSGDNRAGGLVGVKTGNLRVVASYWDTDTSRIMTSADGEGKTTTDLQSPEAAEGIYGDWNDNWDFGTSQQYPVLKYVRGDDEDNPACRERDAAPTRLPICRNLLSPITRGLDKLLIVEGNLSPIFNAAQPVYRGTVVSKTNEIQLIPKVFNPDATISITGDNGELWRGVSGTTSSSIQLDVNGITKLNIVVNNSSFATTAQYTFYLNYYAYKEDIDRDGDGLIDINNLEQLNAIRYQLDGTSYRESDIPHRIVIGCPEGICSGYELMRDLDFDNPAHYQSGSVNTDWTTDSGWQPIGERYNPFTSTFEGNGYTISNLRIARRISNNIGLFGNTGASSEIKNIGLLDVNITGDWRVGGLAGGNSGKIRNSYTTGKVEGMLDNMGGLVGTNLAGGSIANSYSSCDVKSNGLGAGIHIGGLVGRNRGGTIRDSYATKGMVSGNAKVGGLVGLNEEGGTIRNSYSTGEVSGNSEFGGLVGANSGDRAVRDSYWDTQESGIETGNNDIGKGKETSNLKSPVDAVGIYRNWSTENWNFGASEEYPALKYVTDGGIVDPDCESNSLLPKCSKLLSSQRAVFLIQLAVSPGTLSETFSPETLEYDVNVAFDVDEIVLSTTATDANIKIVNNTRGTEYAGVGAVSEEIDLTITTDTVITITVSTGNKSTQYTVTVKHDRFSPRNTDRDEGKLPRVRPEQRDIYEGVEYVPNVRNTLSTSIYQWQRLSPLPQTFAKGPTYQVPKNFVEKDSNRRLLRLILAVSNNNGISDSEKITLIVNKRNDGSAQAIATLTGTTLTASVTQLDPDGMPPASEISYQWQSADPRGEWHNLVDEIASTYQIPQGTTDTTRYRVQISYTDRQNYDETTRSSVVIYRNIDQDNDRLIDISTLEQLNAIRYQSDGTGYRGDASTMRITAGCPMDGCIGYELIRDLDFMDDDSYESGQINNDWTNGEGWQPIGDDVESFGSTFKGNNHTISNLKINKSEYDYIGLFGMTNNNAAIDGVRIHKADILGKNDVGALVGKNAGGTITNSSVSGDGSTTPTRIVGEDRVGGLVGANTDGSTIDNVDLYGAHIEGMSEVGGLVGMNDGSTIKNSRISKDGNMTFTLVQGGVNNRIGGLVGKNVGNGNIINSYAVADVRAIATRGTRAFHVGGLVGENEGNVSNSYAAGSVTGKKHVGGLVGRHVSGEIKHSYARVRLLKRDDDFTGGLIGTKTGTATVIGSYWDTNVSGIRANGSDKGEGKTTIKLQSTIAADGIYRSWSPEVWDFGTREQYPALKYSDSDNECLKENPPSYCGKLLSGQRPGLLSLELPNNAILLEPFGNTTYSYTVLTNHNIVPLIRPVAANDSAEIETISDPDNMTIRIVVGKDRSKVTYTLNIKRFTVTIKLDDPLPNRITMPFDEGGSITLQANYESEGLSSMYQWAGDFLTTTATVQNVTLDIPEYYVKAGSGINTATGVMIVQVTLSKGEAQVAAGQQQVLTINKIDNNEITGEMTGRLQKPEINNLSLTAPNFPDNAADPDGGIDTITYQWQKRYSDSEVWQDIDINGNQRIYTIPETTQFNTQYRVKLGYTDKQGYTQNTDKDTDNPTSEAITFESIDRDNDGLIDILSPESLNAIRHQLDGSGYKTESNATEIATGCPDNNCRGYELRAHIDMAGMDWQPIGNEDNPFNTRFEGNGYTISNLTMETTATTHAGLFGATTAEATISKIGLLNVRAVKGEGYVGGLVGLSKGKITESYVIAKTIAGASAVGGLIGHGNASTITESYAIVKTINGSGDNIGGLAGETNGGEISDSYVKVDTINRSDKSICTDSMQKLVGIINNATTIINSTIVGNCGSTAIFNNP